jgi:hypothetical protein
MKRIIIKIFWILLKVVGIFALSFLFILVAGFYAVRFNLTKMAGDIDQNAGVYNSLEHSLSTKREQTAVLPGSRNIQEINDAKIFCKLYILADYADYNANIILQAYEKDKSYDLAERMILALKLRLKNKSELNDRLSLCERDDTPEINIAWLKNRLQNPKQVNVFLWQTSEHWQIIREAVIKDKDVLNKVGSELNLSPRLVLSVAIVEQLRLYYTQRELFEKVFKPLKILANANKMAWGVMSIKETAAIKAEQNLKDKKSDFYLGTGYEDILNFKTDNPNKERYDKLTDESSHYYSYLYGGVIIKQVISQWEKAGYDISNRPEILATLFNIGIQNSKPKNNPQVGGSKITIGDDAYVFGSLAYEFYYSGDLMTEFPY